VHIRTYNIMRLLAREYDITALCFYRAAERASAEKVRESVAGLEPLASVEAFPIPQEHSRIRLLVDHLLSVLTRRAYTVRAYESRDYRARLAELLRAERFSLIHVDSLDLSTYLPMLAGVPTVCVHHNVESALLRRRAQTTPPPAGTYIGLQSRLTEAEERRWCPAIPLNVVVSEIDRQTLQQIAPEARFTVVPNGVDTRAFTPGDGPGKGIVFVGSHSWQPNRDAMDYFCKNVLPLLRAAGVDESVTWIGRASPGVRKDYETEYGIQLTGYVDDIRPLVRAAACYIAPLRAGGGTRLKILDAWAMGKAVVSTAVGCEGLDARDGDNILVRDTASGFADAIRDILSDKALRARLSDGARRTAEQKYDWEVIGRQMLDSYRELHGSSAKFSPALANRNARPGASETKPAQF
jgi:glycosyltransferase involved in cell wall biosynthesis